MRASAIRKSLNTVTHSSRMNNTPLRRETTAFDSVVGTSSFDNTTPTSIVPLRIAAQDADLEEAFAVTNRSADVADGNVVVPLDWQL